MRLKDEGIMMKGQGWRVKWVGWRLEGEGYRVMDEGRGGTKLLLKSFSSCLIPHQIEVPVFFIYIQVEANKVAS